MMSWHEGKRRIETEVEVDGVIELDRQSSLRVND